MTAPEAEKSMPGASPGPESAAKATELAVAPAPSTSADRVPSMELVATVAVMKAPQAPAAEDRPPSETPAPSFEKNIKEEIKRRQEEKAERAAQKKKAEQQKINEMIAAKKKENMMKKKQAEEEKRQKAEEELRAINAKISSLTASKIAWEEEEYKQKT